MFYDKTVILIKLTGEISKLLKTFTLNQITKYNNLGSWTVLLHLKLTKILDCLFTTMLSHC